MLYEPKLLEEGVLNAGSRLRSDKGWKGTIWKSSSWAANTGTGIEQRRASSHDHDDDDDEDPIGLLEGKASMALAAD